MKWLFIVLVAVFVVLPTLAQETTPEPLTCPDDFDATTSSPEELYACGLYFQQLALQGGYQPDESAIDRLLELVLSITDVKTVIAASSVGTDVDAAVAEIATLYGDSFTGELLFNGIQAGLDGNSLGCAGCHNGETAPEVAGTWTRADEIRLQDPALADYTIEKYLVESILHPNTYIVPDYLPNIMPDNFHSRLDAQELADLVAYLSSQDQLLEDVGGG